MKPKTIIVNLFIFFSAIFLFSCGDNVRFEVPQPEGKRDEEAFSKKICGTYLNSKDSSILTITAYQITRKFNTKFAIHKSFMDSSHKIKRDTSFYDAMDKMDVVVKGDSVYGRLKYTDTLFSISPTGRLRIFKGYYFLNTEKSFSNWDVRLMTFKGKELTILHDWSEDDLTKMRQITHMRDSTRKFKPTRGQLKKFIKQKSLTDGDKYKRI